MASERPQITNEIAQEIARQAADEIIRMIRAELRLPNPDPPLIDTERIIFMSYRRSDSEDVTGRIHDRLVETFGNGSVFRDVADILPGDDFKRMLERQVAACDIMLVIMGREWFNEENKARLQQDDDFVRFEIEAALKREVPILPVWVGRRNSMPPAAELPESLRHLVNRQAIPVRADPDFHSDMDRLIARILEIFDLLDEM